jgi:hypothetical protein
MKRVAVRWAAQIALVSVLFALAVGLASGQGQNVRVVGQIGGECNAVAIQGNYAYNGEGYNVTILNVSTPARPVVVGKIRLPDIVQGIAVSGGMAYVADGPSGLQIVSVSNPSSPQRRGAYDTLGYARGVAVSGGLAYVADYDYGLQIIDVSNPSVPTLRGSYATPGRALGVAVSGGLAYVADGWGGLWILQYTGPGPRPVAPSNLTARAVFHSWIALSWRDNSNNEQGFRIQRKTGVSGAWSQIATVGANVRTYQNTGLSANTT